MTRRRTHGRPALPLAGAVVALGLLLGGCAAGDVEAARTAWAAAGVPDYAYVLDAGCGERALYGRFEVTVEDDVVVEVVGPDGSVEPETFTSWGGATIPDLLDRLADDAGHLTAFDADPATGVPTRYELDPLPEAIDDEECATISDFTPAE
ncbi:hypothetical protein CLV28_2091 [Sediminihabitans luteus]|uniref:Lipoprotein n=1 Tax=Sediminihabitans luteus TaxID=1138585 RepID=A0A2M9CEI3_9CELL|nr:DUF6174 domain-containing protein [Sediminihabitans luteus]PJJ70260.1 hypothetical protein CLV28_2091 [Sediminihabitans luteus]GII97731.1 hypothetical protein Slu03_01090 [Sediminihabitans luteus]